MVKNIVIVLLLLAVLAEGGFLYEAKHINPAMAQATKTTNLPPAGPNAKGAGKPIILTQGMNLKTTPLFKYAFQIAPGAVSASAQKALTGWNVTSQKQSDGSLVVSLTPKDSDDQSQQYTIKAGQTVYFIEQTPMDDKPDSDKDLNYRDDYGIIVDQNGIVQ